MAELRKINVYASLEHTGFLVHLESIIRDPEVTMICDLMGAHFVPHRIPAIFMLGSSQIEYTSRDAWGMILYAVTILKIYSTVHASS